MFLLGEKAEESPPQANAVETFDPNSITSDWIYNFVQTNDWIIPVEDSYLNDNFNLYGLNTSVSDYQAALKMIKGQYFDYPVGSQISQIRSSAQELYGLIHARYLLTIPGVKTIRKKYELGVFGKCPRIRCNRQLLLPIGISPNPNECTVKTFCPSCGEIYDADIDLDGSFFGPYFPHFFQQAFRKEINFPQQMPKSLTFLGIPINYADAPQKTANLTAFCIAKKK